MTGRDIKWSTIALSPTTNDLTEVTIHSLQIKTLSSQISDKISIEYHIDPDDYFSLNGSTHLTEMCQHIGGVREQVGCGICFTNSIRLNGLEGEQTAIMIDNIPIYVVFQNIWITVSPHR